MNWPGDSAPEASASTGVAAREGSVMRASMASMAAMSLRSPKATAATAARAPPGVPPPLNRVAAVVGDVPPTAKPVSAVAMADRAAAVGEVSAVVGVSGLATSPLGVDAEWVPVATVSEPASKSMLAPAPAPAPAPLAGERTDLGAAMLGAGPRCGAKSLADMPPACRNRRATNLVSDSEEAQDARDHACVWGGVEP